MSDNIFYLTGELTEKQILELRKYLLQKHYTGAKLVKVFIHNTSESEKHSGLFAAMEILTDSRSQKRIFPDIEAIAGPNISVSGYTVLCAGYKQTLLTHCTLHLHWNVLVVKFLSEESGLPITEVIQILRQGTPLNALQLRKLVPDATSYIGPMNFLLETVGSEIWAPT